MTTSSPELLVPDPPFIIVYGPTKYGKSSDMLWTAGASGVFIVYHSDGLSGAHGVIGMQLRKDQVRQAYRLGAAVALVQQVVQENAAYQQQYGVPLYRFVGVDDLSMLVENELIAMKQSGKYNEGKGYNFSLWTDLMDLLIGFGNVCRYGNLIILANAHVREPSTNKQGEFFRGGPYLPSAKMVKKLPHVATSIWKVEAMPGTPLYPIGIRCEVDPNYIMGDRRGLQGTAPLNTAERLRSIGFEAPRPAGLEWIEDWANVICARLDEGKEQTALLRKAAGMLSEKGYAQQHVYWAIRDGLHRHTYKKIASTSLLALI